MVVLVKRREIRLNRLNKAAMKVAMVRRELWFSQLDKNGEDIYNDPVGNRLYKRYQDAVSVAVRTKSKLKEAGVWQGE